MLTLNKKQLKMLTLSSKSTIDCTILNLEEIKIITFLEKNLLVDAAREPVIQFLDGQPNPYKGSLISAQISEHGKSFLEERLINNKRYKHSFIVSAIAVIISALSLLLSLLSLYIQLY